MFIIKHDDEMKARDLTVMMLCTAQDILKPFCRTQFGGKFASTCQSC